MPIQIYRRQQQENPDAEIAKAILGGTQGFLQGRQIRRQNQEDTIANAYKMAQISELQRKANAYGKPLPEGFVMTPDGEVRQDPGYFNVSKEREKAAIKAEEDARAMAMFQGLGNNQGLGAPVGTTMRLGRYNIPLNPKLTGDEQAAISSYQAFQPQAEEINNQISGGVLNSTFGNIGRTIRQGIAQSGIPLLSSYDKDLQALQSNISSIRRYAFGEGGKNLTGTEKQIVDSLLNIQGKSNDQISKDYSSALEILKKKNALILGGANAVNSLNPNLGSNINPNDPLEQEALAAINAGADANQVRQRIAQLRGNRG